MTVTFDASHGGYPGEVIPHDLYLECEGCRTAYPIDSMGLGEPCDFCDAPLIEQRAYPAPIATLRMF